VRACAPRLSWRRKAAITIIRPTIAGSLAACCEIASFAAGPQTVDGGPPGPVNQYAAHVVVRSGTDGDRLRNRIDSCVATQCRDGRETPRKVESLHAPCVEKNPMPRRDVPPDGTCNDIAGRKLGAGGPGHEAIAMSVDQDRAFSTHGLTDELQWRGLAVERRRMELDKFKIGHDGAGARCEREALAKGSSRIGPMQKQTSDAAGRDDDTIGGKKHGSSTGMAKKAHHCIVFDDQALCRGSLDHRDRRRRADLADQGLNDVPACCITPGMDDPAARMRGLEAEDDLAAGIPIENDAESRQLFDRGGRRGED
jgi:hypothetical protein